MTSVRKVAHIFGIAYLPQFSKRNRMHVVSPWMQLDATVFLHKGKGVAYQMSQSRRLISDGHHPTCTGTPCLAVGRAGLAHQTLRRHQTSVKA
jgi:hypothetical protein